ncbi:hypothetical protein [Hoeflea sp. TYP-13]|uniref:hypothetical protein n=1 Tax=Hoeflea sp. TYP-13 TaxID=3230023 RepID=UPI0034C60E5E
MFKKLRSKLSSNSDRPTIDGVPPLDGNAGLMGCDEFIEVMGSFENQCKPCFELAERARQHAETVAETGKIDQTLLRQIDEALTEITTAEIQIEETLEVATDISPAAQARFETAADRIADAHSALESALNDIRMAKVDFDSYRDDEDDDDDFDMD